MQISDQRISVYAGPERGRIEAVGERITGIRTTQQSADTAQCCVQSIKHIQEFIYKGSITRYQNTRVGGRAI